MCLSVRLYIVVLVLIISFAAFSEQNAFRTLPCRQCATAEECEMSPPQICVWGEGRDMCNRRICLKGPGEKCGGRLHILGSCGDGMMCSHFDNRCHGCYIPTMSCYPNMEEK